MSIPTLYDRLVVQQDRALAIIGEARPMLMGGLEGYDAAKMATGRWQLARVLTEYHVLKHREIFDPAIADGNPERAALARQLKAACIAVGEEFRAYVTRWSPVDKAAMWPEYRLTTLNLMSRLCDHIARERLTVQRLLAHDPRQRAATERQAAVAERPLSRAAAVDGRSGAGSGIS